MKLFNVPTVFKCTKTVLFYIVYLRKKSHKSDYESLGVYCVFLILPTEGLINVGWYALDLGRGDISIFFMTPVMES
ncbi:hypothetical protein XELAEV_18047037mg [Xenopus laevis]|uniref:Uncharacterized protein n=1 Tax=Xenopus laevis TaxID=8355 RepID=A0A974BUP2_XENLA|nr:hypothetical protein XELAEV_18047037mg [Xenopus laevis]